LRQCHEIVEHILPLYSNGSWPELNEYEVLFEKVFEHKKIGLVLYLIWQSQILALANVNYQFSKLYLLAKGDVFVMETRCCRDVVVLHGDVFSRGHFLWGNFTVEPF
jgi:hypothetical protein